MQNTRVSYSVIVLLRVHACGIRSIVRFILASCDSLVVEIVRQSLPVLRLLQIVLVGLVLLWRFGRSYWIWPLVVRIGSVRVVSQWLFDLNLLAFLGVFRSLSL